MRPLRVAVVGSGPAGLYAVDGLIRQQDVPVTVDVIDRLPTPYGLVRYGVAPDHVKMKAVIKTLQRVFDNPAVRFLGDVTVGEHLSHDDLRTHYDAVIYSTGASIDQRMRVPGEDLPGSCPATEFVSWYCGHPDAGQPFLLDESVKAVAVIGVGNVAVDVVRLLAKSVDELCHTDLPLEVLDVLRASSVEDIYMIGRRGPAYAKFTTKELRELGELAEAEVVLEPAEVADAVATAEAVGDKATRSNCAVIDRWAATEPTGKSRRVRLRFWLRPVEILGEDRVTGLKVERTFLDGDGRVRGTGETETLPVQLVLRAVGYRSVPLPGVPFDDERGVVANDAGRVLDKDGTVVPGEYVAGWIKRGPTGVIGTNKGDALETVRSLLEDAGRPDGLLAQDRAPVDDLLRERGIEAVTYQGWLAIDDAEMARGRAADRDRIKIWEWDVLRKLGALAPPAGLNGERPAGG